MYSNHHSKVCRSNVKSQCLHLIIIICLVRKYDLSHNDLYIDTSHLLSKL